MLMLDDNLNMIMKVIWTRCNICQARNEFFKSFVILKIVSGAVYVLFGHNHPHT